MQVRDALIRARDWGLERIDAQWLLEHLVGRPRAWLIAHDDHRIGSAQQALFETMARRRLAGEPLAYIVGEREFCGLVLQVSPDVLVPRPETELLVEWAIECLPSAPEPSVAELGTGSGAIALAIKHAAPAVSVTASDSSAPALEVARRNGLRHGLTVEWLRGDWWAPFGGRCFGLALSNPPYVAGDDPHLLALHHEPRLALTPEGDGLSALQRIVEQAPQHLLPGAWLLLEHGHDQAAAVAALLAGEGFERVSMRRDLAGLARCSGARWPGAN